MTTLTLRQRFNGVRRFSFVTKQDASEPAGKDAYATSGNFTVIVLDSLSCFLGRLIELCRLDWAQSMPCTAHLHRRAEVAL